LNKSGMAELLGKVPGSGVITTDESMATHTSFRIGGPADVFVRPDSVEGLSGVLGACARNDIPVMVMGNGTNLIVLDSGIRGVVIQLKDNFDAYEVNGCEITAEPGILLSRLSRIALEHGLTGLEFAEGIPGTLGGAVTMNAGAYDGDMSMIVGSSEYMGPDGHIRRLDNSQHRFEKRSSFIQTDGGIVLKTRLGLREGKIDDIKAKMNEFGRKRKEKQPLDMPSAGSIFKRPEGYFAGKLVQDCGLRGYRIGGAEVSALHCGFIVNAGNATARDVTTLIKYIQDKVNEQFGVQLHTEVKIVGEEEGIG